jgi:hypothetical protein
MAILHTLSAADTPRALNASFGDVRTPTQHHEEYPPNAQQPQNVPQILSYGKNTKLCLDRKIFRALFSTLFQRKSKKCFFQKK